MNKRAAKKLVLRALLDRLEAEKPPTGLTPEDSLRWLAGQSALRSELHRRLGIDPDAPSIHPSQLSLF